MRAKLISLWVFVPLMGTVTRVLASPAGQITPSVANTETINQIITIAIGAMLTLLLRYLQRNQTKTNERLQTVEAKAAPVANIQHEADTTKAEMTTLKDEIALLRTEIETLKMDYKAVTAERNEALQALKIAKEQRAFDEERWTFQTNKLNNLLVEERGETSKLQTQNATQQKQLDQNSLEIKQLREQLMSIQPVNDLASAIVQGMRELVKTRTKEVPIIPTPGTT